jgi:hypothetical protein
MQAHAAWRPSRFLDDPIYCCADARDLALAALRNDLLPGATTRRAFFVMFVVVEEFIFVFIVTDPKFQLKAHADHMSATPRNTSAAPANRENTGPARAAAALGFQSRKNLRSGSQSLCHR